MLKPAEYTFAEALQDEDAAVVPSPQSGCPPVPAWSADRAHARIRFLAGFTGLIGVALIVTLLVMGAPAHG